MADTTNGSQDHLDISKIRKIPEAALNLRRQFDGERCMISLDGELRHGNADVLFEEAVRIYESGTKSLVLDWRDLTYCDTAGLQSLVQIYKYVQNEQELELILFTGEGNLLDTLRTCRFDKFINISHDKNDLDGNWQQD